MLVLLDIERLADGSGKGVVGIVKCVLAERQREHADVLEVDHPNATVCVDEGVVLLDVGVINRTRRRLERDRRRARFRGARNSLQEKGF